MELIKMTQYLIYWKRLKGRIISIDLFTALFIYDYNLHNYIQLFYNLFFGFEIMVKYTLSYLIDWMGVLGSN